MLIYQRIYLGNMGNTGNMRAMVKICGKYVGIKDPWWKQKWGIVSYKIGSEATTNNTCWKHVGGFICKNELPSGKLT
jgi:hypothetical protein